MLLFVPQHLLFPPPGIPPIQSTPRPLSFEISSHHSNPNTNGISMVTHSLTSRYNYSVFLVLLASCTCFL